MCSVALARMSLRANKFREVEGGTTWYASRTEAVGLGRVVPSSHTDSLPDCSSLFADNLVTTPIAYIGRSPLFGGLRHCGIPFLNAGLKSVAAFILPGCGDGPISLQNTNFAW